MTKIIKLFFLVATLISALNFFTLSTYADVSVPPCRPGQDPTRNFCNAVSNKNENNFFPKNNQKALIIYTVSGGIIAITTIISAIILIGIKRKNVK